MMAGSGALESVERARFFVPFISFRNVACDEAVIRAEVFAPCLHVLVGRGVSHRGTD